MENKGETKGQRREQEKEREKKMRKSRWDRVGDGAWRRQPGREDSYVFIRRCRRWAASMKSSLLLADKPQHFSFSFLSLSLIEIFIKKKKKKSQNNRFFCGEERGGRLSSRLRSASIQQELKTNTRWAAYGRGLVCLAGCRVQLTLLH